jgi:hypothetical protein
MEQTKGQIRALDILTRNEAGEPRADIAKSYGVSESSIYFETRFGRFLRYRDQHPDGRAVIGAWGSFDKRWGLQTKRRPSPRASPNWFARCRSRPTPRPRRRRARPANAQPTTAMLSARPRRTRKSSLTEICLPSSPIWGHRTTSDD